MARATATTALRALSLSGVEAAVYGLLIGGCRLAFAAPTALSRSDLRWQTLSGKLNQLGGALVEVQSDQAAALMAAGAAMEGARAFALVADGAMGASVLAGLDDLCPALVDVSGSLPLTVTTVRAVVAPHTPQSAFEAGLTFYEQIEALHGPGLLAGLTDEPGEVQPLAPGQAGPPLPIHHTGPDNPDLLLVGAGPAYAAMRAAADRLEAEGVAVAHLHLLQALPFPGAILAPALTSARRVLVVEPGGPGTLAGLIRSHLGPPVEPFGELHRLAGAPLSADQVVSRAREVLAL